MQFTLRSLFVVITILAIPLFILSIMPHPRSRMLGYQYNMQIAFDQIQIGKPYRHVIQLLGPPDCQQDTFSRAIAYQKEDFADATLARCVQYAIWRNGTNWFYCVGIDQDGNIVLKADGNS